MSNITTPTAIPAQGTITSEVDLDGFLTTLQMLIREPAVVGTEDSFFRTIRRELEEVGVNVCYFQGVLVANGSWRYALSWFQGQHLLTDRLLVIDTSPYPSREAAEEQDVVLRRKDANGAFATSLTNELVSLCDEFGSDTVSRTSTSNR